MAAKISVVEQSFVPYDGDEKDNIIRYVAAGAGVRYYRHEWSKFKHCDWKIKNSRCYTIHVSVKPVNMEHALSH